MPQGAGGAHVVGVVGQQPLALGVVGLGGGEDGAMDADLDGR